MGGNVFLKASVSSVELPHVVLKGLESSVYLGQVCPGVHGRLCPWKRQTAGSTLTLLLLHPGDGDGNDEQVNANVYFMLQPQA